MKLGLERFSPKALIWAGRMHSDQCLFRGGYLWLPHTMQSRLQAAEWRPLMASVLLRQSYPRGFRRLRTFFVWWLLGFAGVVVVVVANTIILRGLRISQPVTLSVGLGLVFGFLGVVWILGFLSQQGHWRELQLRADEAATSSPGGETLLQVLLKIDSLQLGETGNQKVAGLRARFSIWPSVRERIRNLQALHAPRSQPKNEFHNFNKYWGMEPR